MGLVNDFPDGRYPSANSVQGFGPAIRKVLDYKSIRGQFEGIRGELEGRRVTTLHLQINSLIILFKILGTPVLRSQTMASHLYVKVMQCSRSMNNNELHLL